MPPLPPSHFTNKKGQIAFTICPSVLALPIFPARLQASIFGRSELNFRVRNGNGWTLALISTNYVVAKSASLRFRLCRKLHPLPCSSFSSRTRLRWASLGGVLRLSFTFSKKKVSKENFKPFSLLTAFFNSKYSIKFSSHCQELSLSYKWLSIKFFLPTFSFKKK